MAGPIKQIKKARKKIKKMLSPMMEANKSLLEAAPMKKLGKNAMKKTKKKTR